MSSSVTFSEIEEAAGLGPACAFEPLEMEEAREAAVTLIDAGFAVVPAWGVVEPGVCACATPDCAGKHTIHKGWGVADRAFMRADQGSRWWTPEFQKRRATDNIAIVCYGSQLVVADVDSPSRYKEWIAAHGGAPPTLESRTGRGTHYFFRAPDDNAGDVPGTRAKLGNGSGEWRWKAIVIAPPSVHLGTGSRYQWAGEGLATPIADLPAWMNEHAFSIDTSAGSASSSSDAFIQVAAEGYLGADACRQLAEQALIDAVDDAQRARPGTRRTVLNATAFDVGKWGEAAHWNAADWRAATSALADAGVAAGLGDREAEKTTIAALNDGAATFRRMNET